VAPLQEAQNARAFPQARYLTALAESFVSVIPSSVVTARLAREEKNDHERSLITTDTQRHTQFLALHVVVLLEMPCGPCQRSTGANGWE